MSRTYPLRPELTESIYYLHEATKDDSWILAGRDILNSIRHTEVDPSICEGAFATVNKVQKVSDFKAIYEAKKKDEIEESSNLEEVYSAVEEVFKKENAEDRKQSISEVSALLKKLESFSEEKKPKEVSDVQKIIAELLNTFPLLKNHAVVMNHISQFLSPKEVKKEEKKGKKPKRRNTGYLGISGEVKLEDSMPSFFLSELCKYLFLLFSPDHFLRSPSSMSSVNPPRSTPIPYPFRK